VIEAGAVPRRGCPVRRVVEYDTVVVVDVLGFVAELNGAPEGS
jgi:hypothetical protein